MIRAYDKLYLEKTRVLIANMFDYSSYVLNIPLDKFFNLFLFSSYCERVEKCDVSISCGKSGVELAKLILEEKNLTVVESTKFNSYGRSKEYWLGYYLTYFQWLTSLSFRKIKSYITIDEILKMYDAYHEADVIKFCEDLITIYNQRKKKTNLKILRQLVSLSQKELADKSGVPVRTIQQYEQRIKNINKANGESLIKLAIALNCEAKDLLEVIFD